MSGLPEADELEGNIRDAMAETLATCGAMATRFVLVLETIDDGGERFVWVVGADGMMAHETLGMLEYAKLHEQRWVMGGEDDGDDD